MLSQSEVDTFVQTWFQGLNEHIDVESLLPLVADEGLEMVFPEQTLRNHADFRGWYDGVGESFTDQDHEVEEVISQPDGEGVALNVTVVWRAVQKSDGENLAFRATQSWVLDRSPATENPPHCYLSRPYIGRYLVHDGVNTTAEIRTSTSGENHWTISVEIY